ncbi:pectin esterase, partial [Paenibacillus sepulcri]|nr:pectin esterase [Paenibacillus sepulcri]
RAVFRDVCIRGNQDTLYTPGQGRQYYADSYIEGTVDFIFGSATAVFERCEIHSIRRHSGYVTAASTAEEQAYGYVFVNCKLTGTAPEHSVSLGRPWRPHAKVAFVRSWMDRHIRPAGWDNWRDPSREKTASFAEFGSTGPGARTESRAAWAKRLPGPEADGL